MKKIVLVFSLVLSVCLVACSGKTGNENDKDSVEIEKIEKARKEADKEVIDKENDTDLKYDNEKIDEDADNKNLNSNKKKNIEFIPNEGADDLYTADVFDGTIPARYLDMCGIPYIVNDFLQNEDHSEEKLIDMLGEPDEIIEHVLTETTGSMDEFIITYYHYCYRTTKGCTYYARYIVNPGRKFGGFYVDYDDITEERAWKTTNEKITKADYSAYAITDIRPFQEVDILYFRGTRELTWHEKHISTLSETPISIKALENRLGQYGLLRFFDEEKCYISWCLSDYELLGMEMYYTSEYSKIDIDHGRIHYKQRYKDELDELGVKYEG